MEEGERKNKFAENFKAQRLAAGLSQVAAAKLLGIAQPAVARYENGLREPDLDDLMTIAEKLSTTPNDLLGLREASTKHPSTSEAQAPKHQPPGSLPACSKCPYKKKWQKVESMK